MCAAQPKKKKKKNPQSIFVSNKRCVWIGKSIGGIQNAIDSVFVVSLSMKCLRSCAGLTDGDGG